MNPVAGVETKVFRFTVNPFQENSYVLLNGKEAVLVDPGFFNASELKAFTDVLKAHQAELLAVVLTHAHIDHILGLDRVLKMFGGIQVFMHEKERPNWDRASTAAAMFGLPFDMPNVEPTIFEQSNKVTLGSISINMRFVPGHSPGHVILLPEAESYALSGDTVFNRSIGRTDLPGGNTQELLNAIKSQVFSLPDTTVLFPGHGPETTVGFEKVHNPYLGGL